MEHAGSYWGAVLWGLGVALVLGGVLWLATWQVCHGDLECVLEVIGSVEA